MNVDKLAAEPSCVDAKNDLIAIGNKEIPDCVIYAKSGSSVVKQQDLGITEPVTSVKFRYTYIFYHNFVRTNIHIQ